MRLNGNLILGCHLSVDVTDVLIAEPTPFIMYLYIYKSNGHGLWFYIALW